MRLIVFFVGLLLSLLAGAYLLASHINGIAQSPRVPGSFAERAKAEKLVPAVKRKIETHLYVLSVDPVGLPVSVNRGAMAKYLDDLVVTDRFGVLFSVDPRQRRVTKLPFSIPVDLSAKSLARFEQITLSVLDIEIIGSAFEATLYASYLLHERDRDCLRIALSAIDISRAENPKVGSITSRSDWRLVYKTNPCVPVTEIESGGLFGTGGRIKAFGDGILLTVGSMALDGLGDAPNVSQDTSKDYGKILLLDVATGRSAIFSMGHRNPQGLAIMADGRIVASEHGPRGGDEVNIIVRGGNYGWPLVTYGTLGHRREWPLSKITGRHDEFRQPLFSFVPSMGVGELIEIVHNPQFPLWHGDILLATLVGRALVRLRVEGDRVAYAERIELGHRIRDLEALSDGTLVALTDDNNLLLIANDAPDVNSVSRVK